MCCSRGDQEVEGQGARGGRLDSRRYQLLRRRFAGGVAKVIPDDLVRHELIEVTALVQTPDAAHTDVLRTQAVVELRPDLTATLEGPGRVVRKQPSTYEATISEVAGDTGANAFVSLYDGVELLDTVQVTVPAAGDGDRSVRVGACRPRRRAHAARASHRRHADRADTANNSDTKSVAVAMYDADGAVVSENYQATQIGAEILREGGNAFDAAAAVQWALNFAEPENTGLGGGVNALVHLANGDEFAIDGRETAPGAVTPTYYSVKKNYSRNGFSVGVPGTLRTLDYCSSAGTR